MILDHLESIQACTSDRLIQRNQSVTHCISALEQTGVFRQPPHSETAADQPSDQTYADIEDIRSPETNFMCEAVWKAAYEARRDAWKAIERPEVAEDNDGKQKPIASLESGAHIRNAIQGDPVPATASISIRLPLGQPSSQMHLDTSYLINEISRTFSLNEEQDRAFRMITEHSQHTSKAEPLRMLLTGPGGTGKSRVIDAVQKFFSETKQPRRVRTASYTGVAARNVNGMTLHAALCLNQRTTKKASTKTQRDLISMWEGVDFLIIDEVSMLGCSLLLDISEALNEAKGNTQPFGGINIIFAGDFCQLPPVAQTRLYSKLDTSRIKSASKRGQRDILGKLLWLSVTKVIILTKIMRQSSADNTNFVDLLLRLRFGQCTKDDYETLNKRVIANLRPDCKKWRNVPTIVSDNPTKDAINERATVAYAERTKQKLHWYYANDKRAGKKIEDVGLTNHLLKLDSGRTNQRLGRLPLVLGMPVIITQNFDVQGGIVNGTTGILRKIRYYTDEHGLRHAVSCVVESDTISASPLPGLSIHDAAILEDTTDMHFIHPYSSKKCTIKRTQLPLSPVFAMTTHKAQGQTMKEAIVDIQSCRGTEAPCVMLSRVKSLTGLLILRPFDPKKIQCRQSEDLRLELHRLSKLEEKTKLERTNKTDVRTEAVGSTAIGHEHSKTSWDSAGNDHATHLQKRPHSPTSAQTEHRPAKRRR